MGAYDLEHHSSDSLIQDWSMYGYVDVLIRTYSIDTVISHHHGEAHQDHIAAQRIATAAARRHVDRLWLWESIIYTHRNVHPFNPQMYVPVSRESFDGKMKVLETYLAAGLLEPLKVEAQRHLARSRA